MPRKMDHGPWVLPGLVQLRPRKMDHEPWALPSLLSAGLRLFHLISACETHATCSWLGLTMVWTGLQLLRSRLTHALLSLAPTIICCQAAALTKQGWQSSNHHSCKQGSPPLLLTMHYARDSRTPMSSHQIVQRSHTIKWALPRSTMFQSMEYLWSLSSTTFSPDIEHFELGTSTSMPDAALAPVATRALSNTSDDQRLWPRINNQQCHTITWPYYRSPSFQLDSHGLLSITPCCSSSPLCSTDGKDSSHASRPPSGNLPLTQDAKLAPTPPFPCKSSLLHTGLSVNKYMHITNGNRSNRTKKGIKISSWNCGGGFITKGKKLEIESYLKVNDIDVMAISEVEITMTSYHYDQLYHISGYNMVFPQSWTSVGKARIICYYKANLEPHIKIKSCLAPLVQPVIWLEIDTSPSFLACFIYREWTSLSGDKTLSGQKSRLKEILTRASQFPHKEVTIMGDMNVDGALLDDDHGDDSLPGILKNFMLEYGFSQLVNQPTRARVANGILEESILDHILTNTRVNVHNIRITKMSNSDHDIISMERRTLAPLAADPVTVRSVRKFDVDGFMGSLNDNDWEAMDKVSSVDEAVDFFNSTVLNSLNKFAPKITFTPRTKSNPTLTKETISSIRERNRADRKAKRTKDPVDIAIWRRLRNGLSG